MKQKFYHHFKDDNILKFISIMSIINKNSRFSYRLMVAQVHAYIMWRRKKFHWNELENIFKFGKPQLEDPQERLFVETVNTPFKSYKVFSAFYLTHKFNLSLLLFMASRIKFPKEKLSLVYALLEISHSIANRFGYPRNVIGSYNQSELYIPSCKEFLNLKNYTTFTFGELEYILNNYGLNFNDIGDLMQKFKKDAIIKELDYFGHSDTFELHPFLKLCDENFLILFPPALLRKAYLLCYEILLKGLGEKCLFDTFEQEMEQTISFILTKDSKACFIDKHIYEKVPFLWFDFDSDKVANVAIILADKKQDINKAIETSESDLQKQYSDKKIFTLLIIQQLNENGSSSMPLTKPTTYFDIEDFMIVMSREKMNLLNLYYFNEDKKQTSIQMSQELDTFAFYFEKGCNFYQDNLPNISIVTIGYSLSMRADYLCVKDEHMVYCDCLKAKFLVHRYGEQIKKVPVYIPNNTSINNLFLLELNNQKLWIQINTEEDIMFYKDLSVTILNWIYAAQYVKGINPLCRDTYVQLTICNINQMSHKIIDKFTAIFYLPSSIMQNYSETFELDIISYFVNILRANGNISDCLRQEMIDEIIKESPYGFMPIIKSDDVDIFDIEDGISQCYTICKRYVNIILTEIADYVNLKDEERHFNIDESKKIMIKVLDYISSEIKKIIMSLDTKILLKDALKLHHASIYMSKLAYRKYSSLSLAYAYIGETIEHKLEYLNEFSEMNTLSQALIEIIILGDIHNESGIWSDEIIDRLFALMHLSHTMGAYTDMLGEKLIGSELIILPNGRLVLPRVLFDEQNSYSKQLINMGTNKFLLHKKMMRLMPPYTFDFKSKTFLEAFKDEYGIDFDKYYKIIDASMEYAKNNKMPVMVITESEFYSKIVKNVIKDDEIQVFKEHFVLYNIERDSLNNSDKWIQRFNRPVQITARPWILYETNIYYSIKTLYENWLIKNERLCNGTLHAKNERMRHFLSEVANKKGKAFSSNIRKYFESLNIYGLYVDSEVNIGPRKLLKANIPLGDIDVLLINKNTKQIVCIEAKNYFECRTTYEFIQQNRKIEKDLPHVIIRDKWCKDNIEEFKCYMSDVDKTYTIVSIFITYNENTYNFKHESQQVDVIFLSAIDIIENPMIVFSQKVAETP